MNRLEFMEEFFHGELGDGVEAGVGVSNQLLGSSKIDAPLLRPPIPETQKPDREETGRANDWLSLVLPGSGRQRSGYEFVEYPAYPTVTDQLSTRDRFNGGGDG